MGKFWKRAGIALLCGMAALLLWPVFGRTAVKGVAARNLSNAKQVWLGVKLYADDHDGHFPIHLTELEPDYFPPERLDYLLYRTKAGEEEPPRFRYDWLYFGAFFDDTNPPPLFIASPQAFTAGNKWRRIIIRGDGSGSIVNDDEYQQELRKTIEAMHQRAGTPPTPATEPPPASPDGAAAPANPKTPEVPDEKPNIR